MQELMELNKMTSMEIAEATGKQHKHILTDIRDEIVKLENGGLDTEPKFRLSERKDRTGRKIPYYELSMEGVLQLAARYDAVIRAKLINLAMKKEQPKPTMTAAEILAGQAQLMVTMERKMLEIDSRTQAIEQKIETLDPDHWRNEMLEKTRQISQRTGHTDFKVRGLLYGQLEQIAKCNLNARLHNAQRRMKKAGIAGKKRNAYTKLDIVASEQRLRELFELIVNDNLK